MYLLNRTGLIGIITAGLMSLLAAGCNNGTFRGSGKSKANPPTSEEQLPTSDQCTPGKEVRGVDVVVIIDNSGSNSETDCPQSRYVGVDKYGYAQFSCGAATNRENAVVSLFDEMTGLLDNQAEANLSVASFPTLDNIFTGARTEMNWVSVNKQNSRSVQSAMGFTRSPQGFTPYGAGLGEAADLFKAIDSKDRSRLVIFVTDGEPTDDNPLAVKSMVKNNLHGQNVKVVTVMITGRDTFDQRISKHLSYLRQNDYSQSVIDELMGTNGKKSLLDEISHDKVEVTDSGKLEKIFKDLIVKEITCK